MSVKRPLISPVHRICHSLLKLIATVVVLEKGFGTPTTNMLGLKIISFVLSLRSPFPNISESFLVDISLMILTTNAQATRYRSISKNRSNVNTRLTEIWIIPNLPLIVAEETFTTVTQMDLSFLACRNNKIHQITKLMFIQLEIIIICSPSHRHNCENAPILYADTNQELLKRT